MPIPAKDFPPSLLLGELPDRSAQIANHRPAPLLRSRGQGNLFKHLSIFIYRSNAKVGSTQVGAYSKPFHRILFLATKDLFRRVTRRGFRWQRGQKCVLRLDIKILLIRAVQRKQGWPVRR